MPRRLHILLLSALCYAACSPGGSTIHTEHLAPGVDHHEIHLLAGPWWIHVIEVDLQRALREGIRLQTAKADHRQGGFQRTSTMADVAIAAVNGDYFYQRGRPLGLQIQRGELLQEPHRFSSALALSAAGEPLVAVFKLRAGLITPGGEVVSISGLNREPAASGLTLYNRFGKAWQDSVRAELGFQLQQTEPGSPINDTLSLRVTQVRRKGWPLRLESRQWSLAAGSDHAIGEIIAPGDTIQLFCNLPPADEKLGEAIGGGPRIIRDGSISIEHVAEHLDQTFATARHPRTAVAYSKAGRTLFLVTVDGRQPGYSVGMSLEELADFLRNRLAEFTSSRANAHQALNLDGGGATTVVVNGQVVNRPSDPTGERPVANALLIVRDEAEL
jgi:hypothetical protein